MLFTQLSILFKLNLHERSHERTLHITDLGFKSWPTPSSICSQPSSPLRIAPEIELGKLSIDGQSFSNICTIPDSPEPIPTSDDDSYSMLLIEAKCGPKDPLIALAYLCASAILIEEKLSGALNTLGEMIGPMGLLGPRLVLESEGKSTPTTKKWWGKGTGLLMEIQKTYFSEVSCVAKGEDEYENLPPRQVQGYYWCGSSLMNLCLLLIAGLREQKPLSQFSYKNLFLKAMEAPSENLVCELT